MVSITQDLVPLTTPARAAKCEHEHGQWLAEVDGVLYAFSPPTQMQKDIWLRQGRQHKQLRESMLRWLCRECGTVQEP